MSRRGMGLAVCGALVAFALGAAAISSHARSLRTTATVVRVVDGDTIELAGGARVRLLQIDAPELGSGECYSRKAAKELRLLVPPGAQVGLRADAALGRVDRYGRLLRYVFRERMNVNLALVARGAATVWFYEGERGRYAATLVWAARRARSQRRGIWGSCRVAWDPFGPATTSSRRRPAGDGRAARCDASYPDFCIPSPPPDRDCADVGRSRFRVVGADPHRFDGDRDGIGCE